MEAFELGLGDPVAISAEHGEGLADLYSALKDLFGQHSYSDSVSRTPDLQIAVVGRPNTGKSTLINRLLKTERLLTGPEAGITRDAISVEWEFEGRPLKLVDTAGLRRKAKVDEKLEKLSVLDTLRAIRYTQVVVLMLDGQKPIEKQDLTIARQVADEGRAMVIALNKCDLVSSKKELVRQLEESS